MSKIIGAPSCGSCKFMFKSDKEMVCRHEPPSGHPIIAQTPTGPQMVGKVGMQPPVQEGGWCGKYQRGFQVSEKNDPLVKLQLSGEEKK